MDEDVADLRGGDEARVAGEEVGGGEGGGLDAEGAEGEEGFFCSLMESDEVISSTLALIVETGFTRGESREGGKSRGRYQYGISERRETGS